MKPDDKPINTCPFASELPVQERKPDNLTAINLQREDDG
jgi:hypothetical protein